MFLHARKGHVEPLGKGCDRSVRTPELLQNAASGGVRERAERGIEVGLAILNHTVQCTTWGDGMQWEAERPLRCRRAKKCHVIDGVLPPWRSLTTNHRQYLRRSFWIQGCSPTRYG